MYRIFRLLIMFFLSPLLVFTSCNSVTEQESSDSETNVEMTKYQDDVEEILASNCSTHEEESDYTWNAADAVQINLSDNSIVINGSGAEAEGSTLTITSAGTYKLSGSLSDGQVVVNSGDEGVIKIVLSGVNINNASSAPFFITSSAKTIIILDDDTQNYLTDAEEYVFEDGEEDEPNAALFSKDDFTITGTGTLTVNGNYDDGITSKDGLIIRNGNITVNSVDDGIRGKDYLVIENGTITVNSGGDGLKSDNDETDKGFILVKNGSLDITSAGDAVTAETDVLISGGQFTILSGGGSSYYSESVSSKAIKGLVNTIIDNGTFLINSADDAVHSNSNLVINNGTFEISTGDDGIHSDSTLGINSGEFTITKSYEGIESANLSIAGGTFHIVSSDDGLNVAGGNDGSGWGNPGGPGQNPWSNTGDYNLYISGGYIVVDALGDGIDANGSVAMTGGTVIITGPTSNANGAIDYDVSFQITGGFIIAAGSSGMAMAPDNSSSQRSILCVFSTQQSGTMAHLQTSSGETLFSFTPERRYQSIAFSCPELATGNTYELYFGGSSTGSENDGLILDGSYTPGTKYASFSLSGVVTTVR